MRFVAYFFFQAEDGIRDLVRSRGLGDVYKRQVLDILPLNAALVFVVLALLLNVSIDGAGQSTTGGCLLYTSDAADDLLCVDLGGRRIIKKKNNNK